jgi:DNA-directed RNA polymerase subunit N (RpoN/RPB10)
MLIPVRCFTCGKVLADKWTAYRERVAELDGGAAAGGAARQAPASAASAATPEAKAMDELGIKDLCCRVVMLTTVEG